MLYIVCALAPLVWTIFGVNESGQKETKCLMTL